MLTPEQLQQFKDDGVLVLHDFFSPQEIDRWRCEVECFYEHPDSYEGWRKALDEYAPGKFKCKEMPTPVNHLKLSMLLHFFNKDVKWEGTQEFIPKKPNITGDWLGANTPHLDFPVNPPMRFLINTTFYLDNMMPYNAPFMYWKGSHKIAWDYFRQKPEEYGTGTYLQQQQTFKNITDLMQKDPIAFTGRSGDLLIWNPFLLHSPSANISYNPRFAFIGRWGTKVHSHELYSVFSGDMWRSWYNLATATPEISKMVK